jgi:hypothetical protein
MSASQSVRSVPDTELGLTQGEIQLLRTQQQLLAQRSHHGGPADRGRGTSRVSGSSTRNPSAASSTGTHNRLVLHPESLSALNTHLDNVVRVITGRIHSVSVLPRANQLSMTDSSLSSRRQPNGLYSQTANATAAQCGMHAKRPIAWNVYWTRSTVWRTR